VNPFAAIYAWWLSIPTAIREPLKSATLSAYHGLLTALGTAAGIAFSAGQLDSPQHAFAWLEQSWWGILIGFLVGGGYSAQFRARQANVRVANTVQLGDGVSAVFTKSQPPAPPAKE